LKVRRTLLAVALLAATGAAVGGAWLYRYLAAFRDTPFGSDQEKVVEIAPGTSARQSLRLLARAGAISSERRAWLYVRLLKRDRRPIRAGEYAFTGPLRPDEVLERLYRGEVKLYHFTVPEGLRMEEIAAIVEAAGLGKARELLSLMHDPAFAKELGVPFPNLEGYLYPDTYSFPRGPRPQTILKTMVGRTRDELRKAMADLPAGLVLDERQGVTLASIIEKETGSPAERPRISCVFHSRLRLGMRLQTDPTVLYATMLRNGGHYPHNITRADLLAPSRYNTYTVSGLPPGPIASPGAAALQAAFHPLACSDLYFVSRNDGTHVFCPDLRCHERAVHKWQVEYFRARRTVAR
jgi:UPF0755 protein